MNKSLYLFFVLFSFSLLNSHELSWSSPETLSMMMVDASDPQIVMDSSGNSTAAWVENGFIIVSSQPLNGSWGGRTTLSSSDSSSPRLAVDGSGDVTAIWLEGSVVKSSTLPFGGSWGAATTLSLSGASSIVLAVNSNGDAVAVWDRAGFIEAATKPLSLFWSLVSILSGGTADNPHVAIGENGKIVAVWHAVLAGIHNVQSASQTIGGIWTSAINAVPVATSFVHNYPKVSVDSNGNADLIWYRYISSGDYYSDLFVATSSLANASSAWAIPAPISGTLSLKKVALTNKITHDLSGNAFAFWGISYNGGSTFDIEASIKSKGGVWSDPSATVGANISDYSADVAVSSLGDGVFVFMQFDGSNSVVMYSETNVTDISESPQWSVPIYVSNSGENGYPHVASAFVDDTLYASAIWVSSDGATVSAQAATASKSALATASNLAVTQTSTDFELFTGYQNLLTWDASTSPDIALYIIFRNGTVYTQVDGNTFQIADNNIDPSVSTAYGIIAVDSSRNQSPLVTFTYP